MNKILASIPSISLSLMHMCALHISKQLQKLKQDFVLRFTRRAIILVKTLFLGVVHFFSHTFMFQKLPV